MNDDLTFRSGVPNDAMQATELFIHVAPHLRTADFWRWANEKNPFGKSVIEVIEFQKKIVGHYAIMPMQIVYSGKIYKGGFAVQAAVHKQHRNLKNLVRMINRIQNRCIDQKFDFLYGFPNMNIWPIMERVLSWTKIKEFSANELPMNKYQALPTNNKIPVKIERYDGTLQEIEDVWSSSTSQSPSQAIVPRNSAFIKWRFLDHPLHHYPIFSARINGKLEGFIVLKIYNDGQKKFGHIIDILATREFSSHIIPNMINMAFKEFLWHRVDKSVVWVTNASPYKKYFDKLGYKPEGFKTNFNFLPLSKRVPESLHNFDSWFLTFSDSDAF